MYWFSIYFVSWSPAPWETKILSSFSFYIGDGAWSCAPKSQLWDLSSGLRTAFNKITYIARPWALFLKSGWACSSKIASEIEIYFLQIGQLKRRNLPGIGQVLIFKNSWDLINFCLIFIIKLLSLVATMWTRGISCLKKSGLVLSEGNKISNHVKTIFPILPSILNPFFLTVLLFLPRAKYFNWKTLSCEIAGIRLEDHL